jgi:hypothetical protein
MVEKIAIPLQNKQGFRYIHRIVRNQSTDGRALTRGLILWNKSEWIVVRHVDGN